MLSPVKSESQQDILIQDPTIEESDQYPTGGRLILIVLCLALGSLLVAVDTTIISVAIPRISTDFKSLGDIGWYGSAYLATLTAFQPTMGNVYKAFNPTAAYLGSIVLFEVGSTICATAPASYVFIIGRAVAGTGAAGLLQGALGIITYIAPLEKRQLYIGAVVSVFGISACGGPILGGVLSDRVGWRWCFWINLPLGAVILVLVLLCLKLRNIDNPSQRSNLQTKLRSMDPLGITILLGAVCSLLLVLQKGGTDWHWSSGKVIGLLFTSITLFALFGVVQWKLGERATVPLRLLKDRTVLTGSFLLALSHASSYVKLFYIPFYFQAVDSSSAIKSGVQFLSLALPQMVSSVLTSAFVTYTGHYVPFILLGQVIGAVGTGFLTTLNISTPTRLWATFMTLAGLGTGMVENTPYIAIQAVMEKEEDVFIGNGIATFVALLGGSLAISIGSNLLDNSLSYFVPLYAPSIPSIAVLREGPLRLSSLSTATEVLTGLRQAYAKAIDRIMIFALVIVCLGTPVTLGMRRLNLKVVTADRERDKAQRKGESDISAGSAVKVVQFASTTADLFSEERKSSSSFIE